MTALREAVCVIPNRLYYVALSSTPPASMAIEAHFLTIDFTLVYWNFFRDFGACRSSCATELREATGSTPSLAGPLCLSDLFQFCQIINMRLEEPALRGKKIYLYSSPDPEKRANVVTLLCCYAVIYGGKKPKAAYAPFRTGDAFKPFHDASPHACTFNLTVLDCCSAVYKAKECGLFDFDTFNLRECMYYEQVENGDLNWGLADGYSTLLPEDYLECCQRAELTRICLAPSLSRRYFKTKRVRTILRLNKKYYSAARFQKHGIKVIDMYHKDGAVQPMAILQQFILACETATSAIGVHCKAGLGRTGTCLGAYIMKHYGFTAAEAIGWIRICRPGSIIGPQQHFLAAVQAQMWAEGDEWRRRRAATASKPPPGVSAELAARLSALAVTETTGAASATPSLAARPLVKAAALEPDRSNQAAGLLASRRGSPSGGKRGSPRPEPGVRTTLTG